MASAIFLNNKQQHHNFQDFMIIQFISVSCKRIWYGYHFYTITNSAHLYASCSNDYWEQLYFWEQCCNEDSCNPLMETGAWPQYGSWQWWTVIGIHMSNIAICHLQDCSSGKKTYLRHLKHLYWLTLCFLLKWLL